MVIADEAQLLSRLRSERQRLRSELERVNAEIRSTRNFTTETGGYEHEVKKQLARLSSVGLVKPKDHEAGQCPVCNSFLETPLPTVVQIDSSLQLLSQQLEAVEAGKPTSLGASSWVRTRSEGYSPIPYHSLLEPLLRRAKNDWGILFMRLFGHTRFTFRSSTSFYFHPGK
jgi:hypothetical protein